MAFDSRSILLGLMLVTTGVGQSFQSTAPILSASARTRSFVDLDGSGAADWVFGDNAGIWLVSDPGIDPTNRLATPQLIVPISAFGFPSAPFFFEQLVGDFDGDGVADLMVRLNSLMASPLNFGSFFIRQSPPGSFQPPVMVANFGTSSAETLVGDLDGDGTSDLVRFDNGSTFQSPAITAYRVVGGVPTQLISVTVSGPPSKAMADFDGDGADDVVYSLQNSGALWLLRGDLGANLVPPLQIMSPFGNAVLNGVGDLDDDGLPDLTLRALTSPSVFAYAKGSTVNPLGSFTMLPNAVPPVSPGSPGSFPQDVDADGRTDHLLVWSGPGFSRVFQAFRADGSGSFGGTAQTLWTSPPGFSSSFFTFFGDGDGDGDSDAILVDILTPPGDDLLYVENGSFFGPGCAGSSGTPQFPLGAATPGNATFDLGLSGVLPVTPAALFVSTLPGPTASLTCGIGVDLSPASLLLPLGNLGFTVTDTSGSAAIPIPLPPDPALNGLRVFAQWGALDPSGSLPLGTTGLVTTPPRTITFF